jgi:nucleoside-diphosphate-sugar epimerase
VEEIMKVFVAGASGTIGIPLVRALVKAGHQVTALTRSQEKQQALRDLGATPVLADALDAAALKSVVLAAQPTHVIHQLTALPPDGARRASDLTATNRLRIDGTRNLLDAAIAAGAKRFIVGSFAPLQGLNGNAPQDVQPAIAAIKSMESQTLDASQAGKIEGIVLRYGIFYGAENPATQKMITFAKRRLLPVIRGDRSLFPCIHIEDAVSATVAALDHGTSGSVYDIVDDQPVSMSEIANAIAKYAAAPPPRVVPGWLLRLFAPYLASMMAIRLRLSNEKARRELSWHPIFHTWGDGLAHMQRAA